MERLIGVDLGYGFVKATDGREGFLFPSVVGDGSPHQPLRLASQEADPTDNLRLQIGDRVYHVGTLAVRQSRMAYRSLSVLRDEGNDLLVLFLTALSLFCHEPNTTFSVVTGVPPGRMHLADEFIRSVRGDHRVVRYRAANPEELYLRVDRVTVVPQPLGTYWSQVLDSRGQLQPHAAAEGRVGIIDIGFRTTDLVTVEEGEYVPEQSRTVPTGLSAAYGAVAAALLREYGIERENHALDEAIISGEIGVSGRRVDITGLREQAFEQLATKVLVEIRSTWQVADYDYLWFTGGGGQALQRYLVPKFPQASLIGDPHMFGWRRKLDTQPHSVIDRGTEVHGPIHSRGTLEVRGHIRGPVIHDGKLVVAPGGVCAGPVRSVDLYLQGEIHGDVTVTGTLRIGNGGQLFGDADCRRLVIDPGGRFVGINRSDAEGQPAGDATAADPARQDGRPPALEPSGEPGPATSIVFHGYMRSRRRLAPTASDHEE